MHSDTGSDISAMLTDMSGMDPLRDSGLSGRLVF